MKPKGKLFVLVAVFAAIGLVTATGAFTTVSAARTAEINVAGDSAALVAISAASGPNNAYFSTSGGQAVIELTTTEGATGVNQRAETDIRNVFTITNQGTQEVGLWLETVDSTNTDHSDKVALYAATVGISSVSNGVAFNGGDLAGTESRIDLSNLVSGEAPVRLDYADNTNYIELAPGESITVSIFVDLSDGTVTDSENLLDEIIIHAEAGIADGTDTQNGPE